MFGDDNTGQLATVPQFLPEVLNVHSKQVSGVTVFISPYLGQQILMGE
jgi:hypothetical protein